MSDAGNPVQGQLSELERASVDMPSWIARGMPFRMVALLSALIVLPLFLPWNETLELPITIETSSPPRSVRSVDFGVLFRINVTPGATVREGDVLAQMGTAQQLADMRKLETALPLILGALQANGIPDAVPKVALGGEMQTAVSRLALAVEELSAASRFPVDRRDIEILKTGIGSLEAKTAASRMDVDSTKSLVGVAEEQLVLKEELARRGWLSKQSLADMRSTVIERQISARKARSTAGEQAAELTAMRIQLDRIRLDQGRSQARLRDNALQAAAAAQGELERWRAGHLVVAPVAGRVQFPQEKVTGQNIQKGEEIAVVVPRSGGLKGVGLVPVEARGNVVEGAPVRLTFADFPASRYGYLRGEVRDASEIAVEGGYQIIISLPDGMQTTSGALIPLRNRAKATGLVTVKQGLVATAIFGGFIERLRW